MKIWILTYHAVRQGDSALDTPPDVFRRQMEMLAERGWQATSLQRALSLSAQEAEQDLLALTFDDAYSCLAEQAVPVLEGLGFGATLFVPTAFAGRLAGWPHSAGSIMDWATLRQLSQAGFEIGSHSADHLDLSRLGAAALEDQLRRSRCEIEERLGAPCRSLAYPYGRLSSAVAEAARRHYRCAVTTRLAAASEKSDRMRLPRIEMHYYRNRRIWKQFDRWLGVPYLAVRRLLRRLGGQ